MKLLDLFKRKDENQGEDFENEVREWEKEKEKDADDKKG